MDVAGFGSMLKKWVKILLKKFSSCVNHVGNLITAINLDKAIPLLVYSLSCA